MRIEIVFLIIIATFSTILNNSSTEAFRTFQLFERIQNKPVISKIKNKYCRVLITNRIYKLCLSVFQSSQKKEENRPRRKLFVLKTTKLGATKNPAIHHALRQLYYRLT